MSLTPLEIGATASALVAAAAAIWQGLLTRRAIKLSYDTVLLDQRLSLCSNAYSSIERFARLLSRNTVDHISDEDLKQLLAELSNAKSSANELSFKSKSRQFSATFEKFADFYVWFLKGDGADDFTHSFFEEAKLRSDAMAKHFYAYAQSIQYPEEKT